MEKHYTSMYHRWSGMWDRCTNPRNKSYHNYGARGLTVCERWRDFGAYFSDMGPPPGPYWTVDRINNDEGYSPENCRWATVETQNRNRRTNKLTEATVRDIIFLTHEQGFRPEEVAEAFGISAGHAYTVALGKHYRLEGVTYPTRLPRKPKRLLTEAEVRDIRQRYSEGFSKPELAKEYRTGLPHIHAVLSRKIWKNV